MSDNGKTRSHLRRKIREFEIYRRDIEGADMIARIGLEHSSDPEAFRFTKGVFDDAVRDRKLPMYPLSLGLSTALCAHAPHFPQAFRLLRGLLAATPDTAVTARVLRGMKRVMEGVSCYHRDEAEKTLARVETAIDEYEAIGLELLKREVSPLREQLQSLYQTA